jgi:GTP-binding protein LepA
MDIRNFVIIAHIDHGKSTLADRLLELSGAVEKRKMKEQYLDTMELERERGITIKMQPVRMNYISKEGKEYIFNLIDTPGHVDFAYEVSRSLAAVEGAILLVDAGQGVQAQTLANYNLAVEQGLSIIPVINKIDLPVVMIEETEKELEMLCGVSKDSILRISAKTGLGVENIFEEIIKRIPEPKQEKDKLLKALVFDSFYDNHKGIIAHIRIMEGELNKGDKIYLIAGDILVEAVEIGYFKPELVKTDKLETGQIGYVSTGIKEPEKLKVGDTIIKAENGRKPLEFEALSGYKEPKPMVFASVYPTEEGDFELLKKSIQKLKLNDSALFYQQEYFQSLGRGFSLGFLGMLHLEIVKERLVREYSLETVLTTPSVGFKVDLKNGERIDIFRASDLPSLEKISNILEPWANLEILVPQKYFGSVMKMVDNYRLIFQSNENIGDLILIKFEAPLMEIISEFYDTLKSITNGYGSMNYDFFEFRKGELIKLDFLIAGENFPAFSRIIPKFRAEREGRRIVKKLKEILPRENFAVALQAAIENKIIARETIPALKKDVTGHLYGGDRTRKMKLWKKQKEGKKRMKERGKVIIPPKVYLDILKKD